MELQVGEGLLPPATKLGQGHIFRSVCQEFCSQGEGSAPLHAGIHPLGPEAGTPSPPPRTRGRHPPPGAVHAGRYGQQAGIQSC